ncbi:hypothetical protein CPB84DRAFT_1815332 [Gymnopilus junonius]|uniref:DUF6589 domain-containing protein n=1 Tax=Gymnopilus junonius TaxID=109634 RepID=A0A9P5NPN3_GYMJU|nr:hypothetical protein CPB84DRAFT_1815332 [Gymnopilus junonius]
MTNSMNGSFYMILFTLDLNISEDTKVILVFGDLLTGKHIRSLLESCTEEWTLWQRFQFCIYVMGLFHLKMAAADAMWHIFIHPKKTRTPTDENSLIELMHEVIQHIGIVAHLDCWHIEAKKQIPGVENLDDFAAKKLTSETLQEMTRKISKESIAKLLHALNYGDIGCVETCFMPWAFIFQGCGKHKYASELWRYLENIHFVYPPGLSHVIQMNILCNPTGKRHAFRAIDWLVEHNNLYTKYLNHQKARILDESPLLEMFCLEHKTTCHSPPKMKVTFAKLSTYMVEHNSNMFVAGQKTKYIVPDTMGKGLQAMVFEKENRNEMMGDGETEDQDDEADVIDDDGSLDV